MIQGAPSNRSVLSCFEFSSSDYYLEILLGSIYPPTSASLEFARKFEENECFGL